MFYISNSFLTRRMTILDLICLLCLLVNKCGIKTNVGLRLTCEVNLPHTSGGWARPQADFDDGENIMILIGRESADIAVSGEWGRKGLSPS